MDFIEPRTDLSDLSATSLITLYSRAIESQSANPIIDDPLAVEITNRLNSELAASPSYLYQSLARGNVNRIISMHLALRACKYDEYTLEFLLHHNDSVVVNLGCGMDTRYQRLNNSSVLFFDLDLPEVIILKRKFISESKNYRMIASSILDYRWMEKVWQAGRNSTIFLAEGVFMYLELEDVRKLVLELQSRFPGSELVCEVVNSRWLSKFWKPIIHRKMQRRAGLGREAVFRSGISSGREMESWNKGIHFLDEWSYLDSNHPKLGLLKILRKSELFRKTQWTVHYRLS